MKTKTTKLLGLLLLISGLNVSKATVGSYNFSQTNGAFTPITPTGTPAALFGTTWDDNISTTQTIPFPFDFNGTVYTQCKISANGFMVFGTGLTSCASGCAYPSGLEDGIYLSGTGIDNGIAGLNMDLREQTFPTIAGTRTSGSPTITGVSNFTNIRLGMRLTATGISSGAIVIATNVGAGTITMSANASATSSATITPRSGVVVETIGTTPSRTFIIQWVGARRFSSVSPQDNFDFQIRLDETSNKIEVVYGAVTTINAVTNTANVGLRSTTSDFNSRNTTSDWSATTASAINTGSCKFSSTVFPVSGLTFSWVPPTINPLCLAPTTLAAGNITATSADLSWTEAGTATQWTVEYGPAGFTPGTGTTAIVTGTPNYSIAGLTASTAYAFYVTADCGANGMSALQGPAGFTTLAAPCVAANIPYTENFDGVVVPAVPNCIAVTNNNGDAKQWETSNLGFSSSPNSMSISFNSFQAMDDWFFTNGLNLTAGVSYQVAFKYAVGNDFFPENLEVKYGTGPTAGGMTGGTLTNLTSIINENFIESKTNFTPSSSGVYYIGFHGNSLADEYIILIDDVSVTVSPVCPAPTTLAASNITATTADVSWTEAGSATQWTVEYGPAGFTPGTGTTAVATGTPNYSIVGLTAGTAYSFYVTSDCAANGMSTLAGPTGFTTLIANDEATGALSLTVGAGCTGAPYTIQGATQSVNEPSVSCSSTPGINSVWFNFVAPASGAVRISTDLGSGNTFTDSRVGLFSATNASDYSTFNIISCDDDGGSINGAGFMSVLYAASLTPGQTYYVQVDKYNAFTSIGTFCIAVDELNSSMLSSAASCVGGQTPVGNSTTYNGWVPLLDANSNLIAMVRNPAGGAVTNFTNEALNINSNPVRNATFTSGSQSYLDRNYLINNSVATNCELQLFFLNTELTALQAADNTITLGNLGITHQVGTTCSGDFIAANGTFSFLPQTNNGSVNGVSWITVNTPSFSNFYINQLATPLSATLLSFNAQAATSGRVAIHWVTGVETGASHFIVERAMDGNHFKMVGQVQAMNINNYAYQLYDDSPQKGENYYRLKMVDKSGGVKYSEVKRVNIATTGVAAISVTPNPVTNIAVLKINVKSDQQLQYSVIDMTGRTIRQGAIDVLKGSGSYPLDLSLLANGTYYLHVNGPTINSHLNIQKL